MKISKPAWISHNGLPICSIDVHPDGSRVATGGQGEDSGRIVIWNMAPVMYEAKESDENVPRILCQLDNHLACVNCVRWNPDGKLLASGGDDKLVMLWSISKTGGLGFGSKNHVESWRCVATLRGHGGDVIDIAWSPHAAWLATCSVDNTVMVWHIAGNPPSLLTVLRGHSGLVKGVSWDPVGAYLTSQSDDKSVRIWRTADWRLETTITSPFSNCSNTTLVLRLSWSPDGLYLVTAHAMNGKVPTAQIIDREGWKYDKDFVGHHMAVTCVRFSGDIMEVESVGKVFRSCCCVLGSRDRSLSVWMTCLKRPVVVVENLFTSAVNDVAWGPRGLTLMACSMDGTVAYLEFTKDELGQPISQADRDQVFQKLYGKTSLHEPDSGGLAVLENPDLPLFNDNNGSCQRHQTSNNNDCAIQKVPQSPSSVVNNVQPQQLPQRSRSPITVNQNSVSSSFGGIRQSTPPVTKQIETRRADGKRRITPVFIPPPSSDTIGDEVCPFNSGDTNTMPFSMSVQGRSKIVVERRDDSSQNPAVIAATTPSQPTTFGSGVVKSTIAQGQQLTAPVNALPIVNSVAAPAPVQNTSPTISHPTAQSAVHVQHQFKIEPPAGMSSLMGTSEKSNKRKLDDQVTRPESVKIAAVSGNTCVSSGKKRDPVLQSVQPFQRPTHCLEGSTDWLSIEKMSSSVKGPPITVVRRMTTANQVPLWSYAIGGEIDTMAGCLSCIIISSKAQLYLINTADGNLLIPVISLSSPVSLLSITNSLPSSSDSDKESILCVTTDGRLYLWNVSKSNKLVTVLYHLSMAPILPNSNQDGGSADLRIKECFLSKSDEPLLALSSGKAYLFSSHYKSWLLVGDSTDPVMQSGSSNPRWSSSSSKAQASSVMPLRRITNATLITLKTGRTHFGGLGSGLSGCELVAACSETRLKSEMAAAVALDSPTEYTLALMALTNLLMDQGDEKQLREILNNLMGPCHSVPGLTSHWQPMIIGLRKRDLLDRILLEIGKNVKTQRLYTEFKNLLEISANCTKATSSLD